MAKLIDGTVDVRAIREQLEISQKELAKKLGVSSQSVHRWETGKWRPSVHIGKRIRALMRVPSSPATSVAKSLNLVIEIKLTADPTMIDLLQRLIDSIKK